MKYEEESKELALKIFALLSLLDEADDSNTFQALAMSLILFCSSQAFSEEECLTFISDGWDFLRQSMK